MNKGIYSHLRAAGWHVKQAARAARIITRFQATEDAGLIRLRAEPEEESYFDVYGEPGGYTDGSGRRVSPEQERKEIIEQLERDGCWYVLSEWRLTEKDKWKQADGVGMCMGYSDPIDPRENDYVPDLMKAALDALAAARLQLELATVE